MLRNLVAPVAAALAIILSYGNAYALDLTGLWSGNDGGGYEMRQVGKVLWWYGSRTDPATHQLLFSNVAHGTISGSQIKMTWADVPSTPLRNSGTLVLKILSSGHLVATKKTGGFGGSDWTLACAGDRRGRLAAGPVPPACG